MTNYVGQVVVIDTATDTVSAFNVPGSPYLISFVPGGNKAYVVNYSPAFISVINVPTATVEKRIIGGGEIYQPQGVAITPDGKTLYISDDNLWMAAIDTASGALKKAVLVAPVADITNDDYVGQPVTTPNGKYVYVPDNTNSTVVMVRASDNSVVGKPITTGNGPFYMAVAPNGKNLYVANYDANSVTVVAIAP